MLRIGFTGVPGSGKTSLSRIVASKCRSISNLRNVELVQEYARRYISKHGEITSIMEQYRILEKQLEWENSVTNEKLDLMLSDSPIFLGFQYCCSLPKSDSKEIMFFNDIFKKMVKLNFPEPRYDIIFHLEPTIKPVDDGIRSPLQFDDAWRKEADLMIKATFNIFKPKYFHVVEQTDIEERSDYCIEVMKNVLTNKK